MSISFEKSRELFLERCIALQLSPQTIKGYDNKLYDFLIYCFKSGVADIENVSPQKIREYLAFISRRMKKISVQDYYRTLRVFFRFLYNDQYISFNPIATIKQPRVGRRIIPSFNNKEIQLILSAYDKSTFFGFRNFTIMATFYSTGIRKSELANIRLTDIKLDINMISIYGKGDKQRNIPLSPAYRRILARYMNFRKTYIKEQQAGNSEYLFINKVCNQLKTTGIEKLFYNLRRDIKEPSTRISAHTWRHTFAKNFLLNGGDIFTLQRLLGHEDISTTRQYIDLSDKELKLQNDKYNPLDNNSWLYYG